VPFYVNSEMAKLFDKSYNTIFTVSDLFENRNTSLITRLVESLTMCVAVFYGFTFDYYFHVFLLQE
jgi:hypothetical protein